MIFTNKDKPLTEDEVTSVEISLGIEFPQPLRKLFIENNGGEPTPYVYRDEALSTVVSETLPLISDSGRGTAVDTYKNLVIDKKLIDPFFFPFAVDGGGDYFFVDCNSPNANVYFLTFDNFPNSTKVDLQMGLDTFWLSLQPEDV